MEEVTLYDKRKQSILHKQVGKITTIFISTFKEFYVFVPLTAMKT
jgi:hypothetical protein